MQKKGATLRNSIEICCSLKAALLLVITLSMHQSCHVVYFVKFIIQQFKSVLASPSKNLLLGEKLWINLKQTAGEIYEEIGHWQVNLWRDGGGGCIKIFINIALTLILNILSFLNIFKLFNTSKVERSR